MFNSFYKNQLNDQEKIIYNKLLDGLKNMSPSISFISKVEIDVMKYFEYVLMDHVDIYYTYQFNYTYDYETKVYYQMKTVKYADYKIGYFYVSPSLFLDFKDPDALF